MPFGLENSNSAKKLLPKKNATKKSLQESEARMSLFVRLYLIYSTLSQ